MNNKSGKPPRTPRRLQKPVQARGWLVFKARPKDGLRVKTRLQHPRELRMRGPFLVGAPATALEALSGLSASIAFKRWSGRSSLRDRARNVRNRLRGEHPSVEARFAVRSERNRRLQPDDVG